MNFIIYTCLLIAILTMVAGVLLIIADEPVKITEDGLTKEEDPVLLGSILIALAAFIAICSLSAHAIMKP